jgi:hypothetical protein
VAKSRITYSIFTKLHGGKRVEGGFNTQSDAVAIAQKLSDKLGKSLFVRGVQQLRVKHTVRKHRAAKNPLRNFKGRMKGYPKHVTIEALEDSKPSSTLAKKWAEELGKYYGLKAEVVYGHKVKITILTDIGEKNLKYWESQGQMKWNPNFNVDGSPKRGTEDNPVSSTEDVIKAWLDGQPDSVSTYRGTLTYVPQGKKLLSYGQPLIWWDEGKKSYAVDVKIASYSMVSRKHYHLARRMWVERFGKDKAPWDNSEVDKTPIEHRGVRGQGAATVEPMASNPENFAAKLERRIKGVPGFWQPLELTDINEHASGNRAIAEMFCVNIKFLVNRTLAHIGRESVKGVIVDDWSQVDHVRHTDEGLEGLDTFGGRYEVDFNDGSAYEGIFYADGFVSDSVNFDITSITIGDSHLKYFGNVLRGNPSNEAPIVTPAQPNPQTKQKERRLTIEWRAPFFLAKNEQGAFEYSDSSIIKVLKYAVSKGMHPDEIKMTSEVITNGRQEWRRFKLSGGQL